VVRVVVPEIQNSKLDEDDLPPRPASAAPPKHETGFSVKMATSRENMVQDQEVFPDVAAEESSTESDDENIPSRVNMDEGRKKKPGIIFLSSIPTGMNVSQTTSFFSEFGKVGRVFLQPDSKGEKIKGGGGKDEQLAKNFKEGWIEFLSKTVAKQVAKELNTSQVGGKKRSKSHHQLWNLKYLPRFKWIHLSERLAYETAVRQQRMRTEISQVKREAQNFKACVDQKKRQKKSKREKPEKDLKPFEFNQKETDDVVRKRKRAKEDIIDESESPSKRKKTKKSKSGKEKKKGKSEERSQDAPNSAQKKSEEGLKVKTKKSKKLAKDKHKEANSRNNKRSDRGENRGRAKSDREDKMKKDRKGSDGQDRSEFLKSVFGEKK